MIRCLKVFFYNITHDITFYITIVISILLLIGSYFITSVGRDFSEHVIVGYDSSKIDIQIEDELALAVASNSHYSHYPYASVNKIEAQLNNSNILIHIILAMRIVYIITTVYLAVFFGRLYKNGAIKNYVIAGISKTKIFAASFISSEIFLLFMIILSFVVISAIESISGNSLIIYWPDLLLNVLCIFLILSVITTLVLVLIFLSQNSLISLIFPITLLIFSEFTAQSLFYKAIVPPYEERPRLQKTLYSQDKEFYYDAETFGWDLYIEGEKVEKFNKDIPNPSYPGDATHDAAAFLFKTNVLSYSTMLECFEYHALVRDGSILRYSALSCCYTIVLLASGCIIAKKRDLN